MGGLSEVARGPERAEIKGLLEAPWLGDQDSNLD